jgi:hypothetical protein
MKHAKLTPELKKKVHDYVESVKWIAGYGEYRIAVQEPSRQDPDCLAEIEPDEHERSVKLSLHRSFFAAEWWQQKNILHHELIHGRLLQAACTKQALTERIAEEVEEQCVNDIARGVDLLFEQLETLREENRRLRSQLQAQSEKVVTSTG